MYKSRNLIRVNNRIFYRGVGCYKSNRKKYFRGWESEALIYYLSSFVSNKKHSWKFFYTGLKGASHFKATVGNLIDHNNPVLTEERKIGKKNEDFMCIVHIKITCYVAFSCVATSRPAQLSIYLFVQHRGFAVFCPFGFLIGRHCAC